MSYLEELWQKASDDLTEVFQPVEKSITQNPVGSITTAVLMYYGMPPQWAAAVGGGAGAAAQGGDAGQIVKASFTGYAMGYMGSKAGSAAGAYGPIAQAAAAGAASSATGAVLTGQDVFTALRSGLVLGGLMGAGKEAFKFMTMDEAKSSVPVDVMAAANQTDDPIGYVSEKMGWAVSDSANIASQAAINEGLQNGDIQTYEIQQAGIADPTDARVLYESGYKPQDVQNLMKVGYSAADLADMASTGVSADTLTTLSNTQFPESQINDLLSNTNGQVAAADIANASKLIDSGKLAIATADTLLRANINTIDMNTIANKGNADNFVKLLDKGVSQQALMKFNESNLDLNKIDQAITDGKLTGTQLNNSYTSGNYNKVINDVINPQVAAPVEPTTIQPKPLTPTELITNTGLVDSTDASVLAKSGYTAADVQKLVDLGYDANSLVDIASTGVDAKTLTNLANTPFTESQINDMLTNTHGQVTASEISSASNLISRGVMSLDTANTLLRADVNAFDISALGKEADAAASLIKQGVPISRINSINSTYDLNQVNGLIDKGMLSPTDLTTGTTLNTAAISNGFAQDSMVSSGLVDSADAKVLASNGYKLNDVTNLTNLGYNAADLADMASVGVKANTLTTLATNTPFTEASINDMLINGVSSNDISNASGFVKNGSATADSAQQLMKHGVNGTQLTNLLSSKLSDQANTLLDKGVSISTLNSLKTNGFDLANINQALTDGRLDSNTLNTRSVGADYKNFVQTSLNTPAPVAPPPAPTISNTNQYAMTDIYGDGVFLREETYSDGTVRNKLVDRNGNDWSPGQPIPPVSGTSPVQPSGPPEGSIAVQDKNGNILYTDGQQYYNSDGSINTSITNPVPGGQLQNALLSPGNQQIINDAVSQFNAGTIDYDETASRINQAVRNDINSGYLKNNNDGTYTAPDGTIYFMNYETGTYDARVGEPGGTGYQGGNEPVTPPTAPVSPPAVEPTPVPPETTLPITPTPPSTQVEEPVVSIPTPIPEPVVPIEPPTVTPTEPIVTPPVTPVIGPPGEPVIGPPGVIEPPITLPVTPPTVEPLPPVIPEPPVITPEPPVVTPPTPPVIEPPVTPPVEPVLPPLEPLPPGEPAPPPVVPGPVIVPPDEPPVIVEPPLPPPDVPIVPVIPPTTPPVTDDTHYGRYKWGTPPAIKIPTGLNPGYITPTPYYQTTNPAQSQYYWGQHPYQPGPTFDPALYNTLPNAPATPWGATKAQQAASAEQILAAMRGRYPLLGTTTGQVAGPVAPR